MAVTEVGCMGVKPNIDIMDQDTPEAQILTGVWKTVTTKPGGPHRVYWGLEREDPSRVWGFFDWDSVEQHQKFAQTHGREAVKDIPKVCTHGEFTKHVTMVPSSAVLQSPLTEVFLVYFPADISTVEREERSTQLQQILAKNFGDCFDVKGLAHGWGLQSDFPVRGKAGLLGSVLMGFVGWSSIDGQTTFHKSDAYKHAVALVQDMARLESLYMFSMSCHHLERKTE